MVPELLLHSPPTKPPPGPPSPCTKKKNPVASEPFTLRETLYLLTEKRSREFSTVSKNIRFEKRSREFSTVSLLLGMICSSLALSIEAWWYGILLKDDYNPAPLQGATKAAPRRR